MTGTTRVHIRSMLNADMREVLAIDQASTYPWGKKEIYQCRLRHNCIDVVAERGDKVVGYMIYQKRKDHFDILRMEIDPAHRDEGIEEQMLTKLAYKLRPHRRPEIRFNVDESDLPKQQLLRKQGYKAEQVERGGFGGNDTYVMTYRMPGVARAQTAENEVAPAAQREKLPLPEFLRQCRKKLAELTLLEWDVVQPDDSGYLVPAKIDAKSSRTQVFFRSCAKVINPSQTEASIQQHLGAPGAGLRANAGESPGRLVVPASWFRQIHLGSGTPGCLADACTAADIDHGRFDLGDDNSPDAGLGR